MWVFLGLMSIAILGAGLWESDPLEECDEEDPIPEAPPELSDQFLVGTEDADLLTGSEADDQGFGYEGNDTLQGLGGDDVLGGGAGGDALFGGFGDDSLPRPPVNVSLS